MELKDRVKKTVGLFNKNIASIAELKLDERERSVVELARMYASDAASFMNKDDYVTAFSAIEYAHGLLDAILKIKKNE